MHSYSAYCYIRNEGKQNKEELINKTENKDANPLSSVGPQC